MAKLNESHAERIKEVQSEIRLRVKPPGNLSFNPYDWSVGKKGLKDRDL